ncbi:MAG: ribulose-phosphate 3-epimerase [Armatimonadota bacterium]|nr:ribulose-phosphate 3-epimerase [Armatimonadota bacterium]
MTKEIKILPSLLAADFRNLSKSIAAVEHSGIAGLHCDIMDGHFVPNITFGPMIVEAVRRLTDCPLYVHLMIERPEEYLEQFVEAGAASLTVHVEACVHLHRVIQRIKGLGVKAGVALNPSTPICSVQHVLEDVDLVLIMTVNPGFGGQSFIEAMLPKIEQLRCQVESTGTDIDIAVDGGIDTSTARRVVRAGANVLIAGTAVFGNDVPASKACADLKRAALSAD